MITFFNLRLKETNDLMRREFKTTVIPFLKHQGFVGNLPSFRRQVGTQCQLLEIQFNRYGKRFAVNLSLAEPSENFLLAGRNQIQLLRSQRLGSRSKRIRRTRNMDHWFAFLKGFIFYRPAYAEAAHELITLYETEGELIFSDLQKAINAGVFCIHLKSRTESPRLR